VHESGGQDVEIVSFREGDAVGMHEITFDSPNDRIYLCHDAKSRADSPMRGPRGGVAGRENRILRVPKRLARALAQIQS